MFSRLILALSAFLLGPIGSGPSYAVSLATSGNAEVSLGDTLGTQFDKLTLAPFSGTLAPGIHTINPVTFEVGVNATVAALTAGLTISESLTVNGNTQILTIPFSIMIDYSDTLKILGGTTLFFDGWKVVLQSLVLGPYGVGTYHAYLKAEFIEGAFQAPASVPLPPALLLFGSALAGLTVLARRRRSGKQCS